MDENNLSSTLIIRHHFAHVTVVKECFTAPEEKKKKRCKHQKMNMIKEPISCLG